MDHLTHIDEPDLPPLRVPYLGESGFKYDGLGFLQFPQRCGLSIETMIEESWLEFDLDGNASFLQAYLYFGFLHEFFSRAHVAWGAGDFICEETCGSRITTKFLPLMIWFWVSAEIHTGPEERESRIEKYSTLFDMIEACTIALTTKDRVKFQKTEKYCHKGSLILSSVTILFEALGKAFRTTYFSVDEGRMTRPTTSPFYVDVSVLDAPIALIDRLLSAGWCRGEIQNLEHESLSCSSMYMYILGSVQRSRLQRNHEKCTKMKCNADQVDKTTYKTKHQIDECQCSFYPQSCTDTMEKICRVLDSGNLPLIKIPQSKEPEISDLEIEVVSYNLVSAQYITKRDATALKNYRLMLTSSEVHPCTSLRSHMSGLMAKEIKQRTGCQSVFFEISSLNVLPFTPTIAKILGGGLTLCVFRSTNPIDESGSKDSWPLIPRQTKFLF